MKAFFEKHAGKFDHEDALRLIHDYVEEAKCLCEQGKDYLSTLKAAQEMLHDYISMKESERSR